MQLKPFGERLSASFTAETRVRSRLGATIRFVLCPPGFLSGEDFMAFAIKDPHSDRFRRPLYICGGDDRRGRVRHFNSLLRQIGRTAVVRSANKLDPEGPRLFRNDLGRRIRLQRRRDHRLKTEAPRGPAGDDQGYASPVSRRLIAIGVTFPTPRLSIGFVAKLAHERARGGVDPLDPFELPKQPRKHVRSLWSRRRSAARDACPSDSGSLPQRFARYSANRVEIKLTAATTKVSLTQRRESARA